MTTVYKETQTERITNMTNWAIIGQYHDLTWHDINCKIKLKKQDKTTRYKNNKEEVSQN